MVALTLLAASAEAMIDSWIPRLQAAGTDALLDQAGLANSLQFVITSQGGSTGKNLVMQVLNFTGKPAFRAARLPSCSECLAAPSYSMRPDWVFRFMT